MIPINAGGASVTPWRALDNVAGTGHQIDRAAPRAPTRQCRDLLLRDRPGPVGGRLLDDVAVADRNRQGTLVVDDDRGIAVKANGAAVGALDGVAGPHDHGLDRYGAAYTNSHRHSAQAADGWLPVESQIGIRTGTLDRRARQ